MKAKGEAEKTINKRTWEQVRKICYWTVVAMQGNKTFKKDSDLFKFEWEVKGKSKDKGMTSKEAQEKLKDNGTSL